MDYMDNGNLWEALPRKTKDGRQIFQWNNRGKRSALEIALGLHFLHDLGCVRQAAHLFFTHPKDFLTERLTLAAPSPLA